LLQLHKLKNKARQAKDPTIGRLRFTAQLLIVEADILAVTLV
jgi:hypothetical protein